MFELLIKSEIEQQYDVRAVPFETEDQLFQLAREQRFDLVVAYVGNVQWNIPGSFGKKALATLKEQYDKPIIVTQGLSLESEFEPVGITFLQSPFSTEQFVKALRAAIKGSHC